MVNLISQSQGFTIFAETLVEIPDGLPLEGTDFGVGTSIDGDTYEFVFSWNGHHRYYSLTVASALQGVLWKGYLDEDTPFLIKNFNSKSVQTPDAYVVVLDWDTETADGAIPPTPSTLGTRHQLMVMRGIVEDR